LYNNDEWDLIINVVYLYIGYITLKAKCIQPEDGLKKRAETCIYICMYIYNSPYLYNNDEW